MSEKKIKLQEYQKKYKEEHRDLHRQYMSNYVKSSETVECPCGGKYKSYSKYKHNKTARHLLFLSVLERDVDDEVKDISQSIVAPELEKEEKPLKLKPKATAKKPTTSLVAKKPTVVVRDFSQNVVLNDADVETLKSEAKVAMKIYANKVKEILEQ